MVRRTSTINFDRIKHIQDRVTIVQGDLLDQVSIIHILQEHRPDEVLIWPRRALYLPVGNSRC